MAEIRYVEVYANGVKVKEVPYVVSDEVVAQENQAKEFNEIHLAAKQALANWDRLTLAQKDAILKNLLRWALWKDGWLKGD